MSKTAPKIAIQWRDENYGSVRAVAAFRLYCDTSDWPQRAHQYFRGCIKRAGLAFHDHRCSYVAEQGDGTERQTALCAELTAAGLQITAGDVRAEP